MFQAKQVLIVALAMFLPNTVVPIFPYDKVARFLLTIQYGPKGPPPLVSSDPTKYKNTSEILQYYGYPFEKHSVMTKDGYILDLHRIPHGKLSTMATKKLPILVIPGMFGHSGSFIMITEKYSPAFILSRAGYDVWLHNNRGTRYSRKHIKLLPDSDKEYWNFSFHEMGIYDMPAAIDYILHITKSKQLYLLGHSMGCAIISVLLAEQSSYSSKIKATFLLAPAMYMENTKWTLPNRYPRLTRFILSFFDDMELLPYTKELTSLFGHLIEDSTWLYNILANALFGNQDKFETEVPLTFDFTQLIGGASIKVVNHYLQIMAKNQFLKYDYGTQRNLELYGQEVPPEYNLESYKVSVSIFYTEDDDIVAAKDVEQLCSKRFTNLLSLTRISGKKFGHEGFLVLPMAKSNVYDIVLAQMSMLEVTSMWHPMTQYIGYSLLFTLFIMMLCLTIFFLRSKPTNRRIEYSQLLHNIMQEQGVAKK